MTPARHGSGSAIFAWLPRRLVRLAYAGTSRIAPAERHYHVAANVTGYIAALSSTCYALTYTIQDFADLRPLVYGNLLSALITATIPFWHRFGRVAVAGVLAATIYSTLFFFTALLGRESGIQLNYLPVAAIAFLILGLKYKWHAFAFIAIALVLHLVTWFRYPHGVFAGTLPPHFIEQTYMLSALTMTALISLVLYYVLQLLRHEQQRSQALLLNILPEAIADRLKSDPATRVAQRHDAASVVFADLCGFTPLTAQLAPEQLVDLLDRLFSRFDDEASRFGLEKIKTIGDAYMAVSGVPEAHDRHARAALDFALAMNRIAGELAVDTGHDLCVRTGIATGPLTAGVIGRTKFAYDVWGETVNRAARLEVSGQPGQITIDEPTYNAVSGTVDARALGTIELKGIGPVAAWRIAVS